MRATPQSPPTPRAQAAISALRRLKDELASPFPFAGAIRRESRNAQQELAEWLQLVPEADVKRAAQLFANVRAADTDLNGKLSQKELESLSQSDRELWKARVALVGE